MVDRERVLARIDDLRGYLTELRALVPTDLAAYRESRTKRACERLLQIAIEGVLDICSLLVSGLRLGLPADEEDLLERLNQAGTLRGETTERLRNMKGLRNLLVHAYGGIDDRLVLEILRTRLGDVEAFIEEVLRVVG